MKLLALCQSPAELKANNKAHLVNAKQYYRMHTQNWILQKYCIQRKAWTSRKTCTQLESERPRARDVNSGLTVRSLVLDARLSRLDSRQSIWRREC